MKKWFFSNDGEVTGPLDLDEANSYLTSNPDVYAWHPSFTQWKPASCVSEFVDVLPPAEQLPLIPKEISDKFIAKKQRLDTKLSNIDDSVRHSQSSLGKLDQQIEAYKELTKNLNGDVKDAIDNIEKKYKTLSRKLSQVKDAVHIAETEMEEVVDDFDTRMSSNDIVMPTCNPISSGDKSSIKDVPSDTKKAVSKAKIAQEKLATPHKRVEEVESAKPAKETKPAKPAKEAPVNTKEKAEASEQGFGVKNMMKSVFKGDSKVEAKQETAQPKETAKAKDEPLSMAERLKLAQNNQ